MMYDVHAVYLYIRYTTVARDYMCIEIGPINPDLLGMLLFFSGPPL